MNSQDIRKKWHAFWLQKMHQEVAPVSLVAPSQDKTVLFNVAGMQPLVPYLSGKKHPQGSKLFNIQRCIRTNDIEEIGDERHLSMFEMMGNWSLGDYFKKESLTWSIEFLIQELGLDMDKLGCSVFGGYTDDDGTELIPYDKESEDILLGLGMDASRIKAIGMKKGEKCDNFWGPAGNLGPCGPSAEFHYDRGDLYGPNDWDIGENDRFIEIWNNVFMEFYKDEKGDFSALSQQNVDTGMGFERLAMVLQDKETLFDTDIFALFFSRAYELSGAEYLGSKKAETTMSVEEKSLLQSYRIVADHLRAGSFLMMDGVVPSNESKGYVLRRLMRRGWFHWKKIMKTGEKDATIESLNKLLEIVVFSYQGWYEALSLELLSRLWKEEIMKFEKTLSNGERQLYKILKQTDGDVLSGENIFLLYDTFGFPLDLTRELAQDSGFSLDLDGFDAAMDAARKKAQSSAGGKFGKSIDWATHLDGVAPTEFIGYDLLAYENPQIIKQIMLDDGRVVMIFDKTPFYAESGGQAGDYGMIEFDDGATRKIVDVKKYEGVFLHFVE